jgi:hypothetical protein
MAQESPPRGANRSEPILPEDTLRQLDQVGARGRRGDPGHPLRL